MGRYDGKPLVRLMECYVLNAIEQLNDSDLANLKKLEPKLREVYSVDGDWENIVETVMRIHSDIKLKIKNIWEKNSNIAEKNNDVLEPQRFAEMFVDANFPIDN